MADSSYYNMAELQQRTMAATSMKDKTKGTPSCEPLVLRLLLYWNTDTGV